MDCIIFWGQENKYAAIWTKKGGKCAEIKQGNAFMLKCMRKKANEKLIINLPSPMLTDPGDGN